MKSKSDLSCSTYHCELPDVAVLDIPYEGTNEQVDALRQALRKLKKTSARASPMTNASILGAAGLNHDGGLEYSPTSLGRFIEGEIEHLSLEIGAKLYKHWVRGARRVNVAQIPNVFHHATAFAMDIKSREQRDLASLLAGNFYFYRRSALNSDYFIRGLLTIQSFSTPVLHVTELQHHIGGDGIPPTCEIDEGFAFQKGGIIYIITRSRELRGATFTIFPIHPVRRRSPDAGEEIMLLQGHQIGGRESTPVVASPIAAERITAEEASKARNFSAVDSNGPLLGFRATVPDLFRKHLMDGR